MQLVLVIAYQAVQASSLSASLHFQCVQVAIMILTDAMVKQLPLLSPYIKLTFFVKNFLATTLCSPSVMVATNWSKSDSFSSRFCKVRASVSRSPYNFVDVRFLIKNNQLRFAYFVISAGTVKHMLSVTHAFLASLILAREGSRILKIFQTTIFA